MLLGLRRCTILQLSPTWEKKSVSVLIQVKLSFSGVAIIWFYLGPQGLSDVPVCDISNKSKTGPYPKNSAEMYRTFIVLISANSLCRGIAIVLHPHDQGYSFKVSIWLSNLEI